MTYILALDQGTTSSRAILFDGGGQVLALAQREFKQHYPQPGWVEHDPLEIWTTQRDVAAEALAAARITPRDVVAAGITNQRETVVVWDRASGEPIYPAIVWQDRRTAEVCEKLRAEGREPLVRQRTGLMLDPYFSGTKIGWLLDHVAGARRRAAAGELACGTIDCWLLYRLSGGAVHATDASNASRTLLMNIHSGEWDDELCACFGVPRVMLPQIHASSGVLGQGAADTPLAGVPLAGVVGDQQGALFGQACYSSGFAKNTYGTGCFLLMNTGAQAITSQSGLLTTVAWQVGGQLEYALEGSVFIGGAVVGWLRDGLGIIRSSSDVEKLVKSVPDSGDVYFVPAFVGLGAPHWDPYARGTIIGLTRGTTAAHIARAAVESVVFQVADLVDAMNMDAARHASESLRLSELRVDGGASVNDTLLQLQADILQLPVVRPKVTETTALGAAYLAGLATGVWKSREEIARHWQVDRRFEPRISADEAAARRARWNEAVERAKGWAQPK
jgi:glycerol kinase